ncbi:hypothetical protein EVAR_8274_1 [Eumeta japonica]|uniref:Uncharacterized protein n=1 Tax=Eumeta variegata TaxID=151549 RepID=A0A4C1TFT8_EUMVA|nr:hypothetical protein EVAR_8274_1 [Eumeta japonica]
MAAICLSTHVQSQATCAPARAAVTRSSSACADDDAIIRPRDPITKQRKRCIENQQFSRKQQSNSVLITPLLRHTPTIFSYRMEGLGTYVLRAGPARVGGLLTILVIDAIMTSNTDGFVFSFDARSECVT